MHYKVEIYEISLDEENKRYIADRKIYEQIVESLDVRDVILVVNRMQPMGPTSSVLQH